VNSRMILAHLEQDDRDELNKSQALFSQLARTQVQRDKLGNNNNSNGNLTPDQMMALLQLQQQGRDGNYLPPVNYRDTTEVKIE
jgi:hypothetical protein